MDLRVLLRYQISGSVFIGWFLLFHYSVHSADWADMAKQIMDVTTLLTFVASIPIGAIIHQFSVTIKNQFFGLCEDSYLSDSPMKSPTKDILLAFDSSKIKNEDETKKFSLEYLNYIKEKISNLNSFYYMRFDNGLLAPLLAYFLFLMVDNINKPEYYCNAIVIAIIILLVIFILYCCLKLLCRKICCLICILLVVASSIGICCYKRDYSPKFENKSNIELTTKYVKVESNIRYIVTNNYSFESSESMFRESQIFVNNVNNSKNLSKILQVDDLQKISIIESKEDATSNQTFTCTSKCTKCSKELTCSLSYDKNNQIESQLHISKAEITKIDPSLLNKILITCLAISFLLLSYIPRIIQELKEYTRELNGHIQKLENQSSNNSSDSENDCICKCCKILKWICEKLKKLCGNE